MYKIGEFSHMTGLSIKALRYYDSEGLLNPASRDNESGYRLYDEDNFNRAMLIKKLRDVDFSISEIKDTVGLCENQNDLNYILLEKRELIEKEIRTKNELIEKIMASVNTNIKEKKIMQYEVFEKVMPEIKVVSIKYKGRYDECGKYAGKLFKELKGNVKGGFFNMYHNTEYSEQADIEVCIPVKKDFDNGKIKSFTLPRIKAITTTHVGKYEDLGYAYKAVFDYAKQNNLKTALPLRDIYIKGPGMIFMGNPNKYITEIVVPIEEAGGDA